MNKRRAPRAKRRMPCALRHDGSRYSGLVLDLSANGLFVQTSASVEPGDALEIELPLPGETEPVRLRATAARRRVVPARLRTFAQGGVGVRLIGAPEAYFAFVAGLLGTEVPGVPPATGPRRKPSALERQARQLALRRALGPRGMAPPPPRAAPEPPAPELRRYRVKVKRGPRFQSLEVRAGSETEAREMALEEAGPGWKALRCEPA
jgi:hypothetical protein